MSPRRSLTLPITLAVIMMSLLAALTTGWILMAVVGGSPEGGRQALKVTLVAVGASLSALILAGVAVYMGLTIKAINLTRRQASFIDSVTHELKSPIASMKLALQTLQRREMSPDRRQEFCELTLRDLERLDHLIDHMLDAGRFEAWEFAGLEEVSLDEAVRECAETTRLRHAFPPDALVLDLEPCLVEAPRMPLTALLRNLIDNAVKYAGSPPRVEVRLRLLDGGRAHLIVADNGPGIPPRMRRKVFGPFVRLGSELAGRKPGTGLGLFIVRKTADRLKAKVRVRDPDAGPGSVFEVELPARPAEAPAPAAEGEVR